MSKIAARLTKLSAEHLDGGEQILAGVRVNLKGTALGIGLSALGGVGLIAGSKIMEEGQDQAADAGIDFAQQMAFGLTQKRIIVWKRSALSGAPKTIIGEMPIASVTSMTIEPDGLGDRLVLTFEGGQELELESVKVDKGQEFVEAFKGLS